jgi:hypothetical protein
MCLLISVLASALQGQPITSSNRFLFIIDASAAMKPLEKSVRETVFDLIYSGLRGQMTNGDTYGIWLVNGQNNTSFPMETWKHKHILELAAGAASYVKTNGGKGKAHLEVALADAQTVLKNVGDLTVILVTDGSTPLTGTRFDDAINARWKETAPRLKRAKATLNTVLVAQDGEFVAWAANSPEFLIEIPLVKPKPKPAKVEVAVTNAPASTPDSVALASVAAPKPRVISPPIIITRETVAQEKRSYYSSTAPTETMSATQVATNAVPEVVPATATDLAIVTNTGVTNAAAASTAPETTFTNPRPAIASTPVATVEPVSIQSVAIAPTQTSTGASTPTAGVTTAGTALFWAGIGAGGMLALVVMVMIFRRRVEPSLISQAFMRERFTLH